MIDGPKVSLLDKLGDSAVWSALGIVDPTEKDQSSDSALKAGSHAEPGGESGYHALVRNQKRVERKLRFWIGAELAWLMNTVNLQAVVDLTPYPMVRTSVLNFGVADLAGKTRGQLALAARARKIREAIITFEPRLARETLTVEMRPEVERENAVTYLITADITSAVQALPVRFKTDIEADTGAATVRE